MYTYQNLHSDDINEENLYRASDQLEALIDRTDLSKEELEKEIDTIFSEHTPGWEQLIEYDDTTTASLSATMR